MDFVPRAVIDFSALRHNLEQARRAAPHSRVFAVIKANAYGHGMLRIARQLSDVDGLAVARVSEGAALRAAGLRQRILVLGGCYSAQELQIACRNDLEVVLHQFEQLALLEQTPLERPVRPWIKVDTGMHRLGVPPECFHAFLSRVKGCRNTRGEPRVMTHLANADDREDPATSSQHQCLMTTMAAAAELDWSAANSAGVLGWPATHGNWVRPGIMLYGASPFRAGRAEQDGLRPVMTLQSRLVAIHRLRKGDRVGYGGSWVCPEAMPVGVAAVGYGDGYPRHAQSGTPVLVGPSRVQLIGRVSMDMITLDLRARPRACVGDPVTLWGNGLPVEEVAECASTIAYELLCGVAGRVQFSEVSSSDG